MADLRTILRELSVILGIVFAEQGISFSSLSPDKFISLIKKYCSNISEYPLELEKIDKAEFSKDELWIINNGIHLGNYIYQKLKPKGKILWCGPQSSNEYPIDISLGKTEISLKEVSYILKNPSFGDYLNAIITPKIPYKTVHVFRKFARTEFDNWFNYALSKLRSTTGDKEGLIFKYAKGEYNYAIRKIENNILLSRNEKTCQIHQNDIINEEIFNKTIPGDIIEHTFSKWIKENLERNDLEYLTLKKVCSQAAGRNMINFVNTNQNINKNKLLEILQIFDKNYFYAKNDGKNIKLYEVPDKSQVIISIKKISYDVPKSQLNVRFTFEVTVKINKGNKTEEIKMHVECRYSHGQFNGIPEAKLYCKDDLSKLYESI